jgi:hypothetical protein
VSVQTSFTISDQSSLVAAIESVDISGAASAPNTTYTFEIAPGAVIGLNSDLPAINLLGGDTLLIDGGGATLRGDGNERGLFVYAGTVEIGNLTISNTAAVGGNGGNGWEGGGGGAGLGGGLFVGANAVVGLGNVNFVNNAAIGGNGGRANGDGYYGLGGGGGMGGAGGTAGSFGYDGHFGHSGPIGGGGGGIGRSAGGYNSGTPAGAGIVPGVTSYSSGRYYAARGGGGGGLGSGGGIAPQGHNGGFGGGGGPYGSGGFGGGAGAFGKTGGWGGGGSGGAFPGPAGFGGGGGQNGGYQHIPGGGYYYYYTIRVPGKANGGGGLGAGGNVFVQEGGVLAIGGGGLLGGAVAGGQPGGGNAGPGGALGSAAFLQGNGILYLVPPAGQTLNITGSIADQAGAGYGPNVQGSGTIAVAGAGRVILTAASTYTGGTAINAGTLQLDNPNAAGSGPIFFGSGGNGTLDIAAPAPPNVIYNFAPGDEIHLAAGPASVDYSPSLHELTYAGGNVLHFDPATAPAAIAYDPNSGAITVPCFAAGTRIATAHGLVPVERLAVGERVRLAGGGTAPVVWLGHRRVDCRRHPRPQDVLPVRIAAHAFGLGRPWRDMRLSPDHAVFAEGVLLPVRYLVNDATIRQEDVASITYWHVELPDHGILLAEGLPAESYLDTGNRAAFSGGIAVMAHPDFARRVWTERACAPLVTDGPAYQRVCRLLIAQALTLGWRMEDAGAGEIRWIAPAMRPTPRRARG